MTREDIHAMVVAEIALCKGVDSALIKEEMDVFADLDLVGDDFIFLADEFHRNLRVKPAHSSYTKELTIGKWVDILYKAQSTMKA